MKESDFQRALIHEIEGRFPGSVVTKIEPYIQGIPDLLVLYRDRWAMLECKKSAAARKRPRPNQERWVDILDRMSFAAFIYPENKEEVLNDLEQALRPGRRARVPKP